MLGCVLWNTAAAEYRTLEGFSVQVLKPNVTQISHFGLMASVALWLGETLIDNVVEAMKSLHCACSNSCSSTRHLDFRYMFIVLVDVSHQLRATMV